MTVIRNKFDFEIGYLIKSPCKECDTRKYFPECSDGCSILDKIQTTLSAGISCTNSSSSVEIYALSLQGWEIG